MEFENVGSSPTCLNHIKWSLKGPCGSWGPGFVNKRLKRGVPRKPQRFDIHQNCYGLMINIWLGFHELFIFFSSKELVGVAHHPHKHMMPLKGQPPNTPKEHGSCFVFFFPPFIGRNKRAWSW